MREACKTVSRSLSPIQLQPAGTSHHMITIRTVEPPSKGHFGNINSGHLSFIEGLSLFGDTIHSLSFT